MVENLVTYTKYSNRLQVASSVRYFNSEGIVLSYQFQGKNAEKIAAQGRTTFLN